MTSFFGELKRRNVVKVAVAYAIVGWILVEVSSTVLPTFEAPQWVLQTITFVVILGFPLALILSWAFDLTPEGIKLERNVAAGESITNVTGRKLDFAIIGVLVLALGLVVYNFVLEDGEMEAGVLPNSVAVLPFDNLSIDPEDAFFAAGIHDEILNQLAKISALNVIARTTMLRYAETDKTIPEIADELNVETVMEGSVRYAGSQVRITAQLIDPATGAHLWSDTYEREFDDIFAIESDIAMNIANALEAEFSVAEQQAIEKRPTDSAEAYAFYLRALAEIEDQDVWEFSLDQAIAADPDFALPYAERALNYAFYLSGTVDDWEQIVRENAERALAIDPTLGAAHVAMAVLLQSTWYRAEAEQAFERAHQANPSDPAVLTYYGRFLRTEGEYEEAIRLLERAADLQPDWATTIQLGIAYKYARDYDASAVVLRRAVEFNPTSVAAHVHLADAEIGRGNNDEALRQLQIVEQLEIPLPYRLGQMMLGYSRLGLQGDVARLFSQLEERATEEVVGDATWAMGHLAIGDNERALELFEFAADNLSAIDTFALIALKANSWASPVLEEPRFQALRDKIANL